MRVIINVYDIQKSCNQKGADAFGLGIYHSGIEIMGTEYAYGGNALSNATGVFGMTPKCHSNFTYKLSIDLGEIPVNEFFTNKKRSKRASTQLFSSIIFNRDIQPILDELSDEFRANKYNLLLRNCNHFSNAFIKRLYGNKKGLPRWINRAAWCGSWVHCLVPKKYTSVIPPGQEEEAAALEEQWKREEALGKGKQHSWQGKGMTLAELSTEGTEVAETTSRSRNSSFIDSFYNTLAGTRTPSSSGNGTEGRSFDMSMSRLETDNHCGDEPLSDTEDSKFDAANSDNDTDGEQLSDRANLVKSPNKSVLNALKNRKQIQKSSSASAQKDSPQSKTKGFSKFLNPRGAYNAISKRMQGSSSNQ